MNKIPIQNYQPLYAGYYQNSNNHIQNKNFSFGSINDLSNINSLSNKQIINNQSPSRPIIFEVPKIRQNSNFNYGARTPPPSYRRRNLINISKNSKFKKSLNSPVIYRKFPGIDSLEITPQNNTRHIRNDSPQPINLRIYDNNNNMYSFFQNYPAYINIEHKVPRLARTPEPKKSNHDNIITNSHNIIFNNNINNNINNIAFYNNNIKYENKPINNFINEKPKEIKYINYQKELFNKHKNSNINYLKILNTNNSNSNLFNNNDLNQNINFNNIINIKKFNINKDNKFKNIIDKQTNNYIPIRSYQNNINVEKINKINQNNYTPNISSQNSTNFSHFNNYNSQNNSYYIQNNAYENKYYSFCNNSNNSQNIDGVRKITNILPINNHKKNIKKILFFNKNNNNNEQYLSNFSNGSNNLSNVNNNNQKIPMNIQNHINIIPIPQNKYIFHYGERGIIRKSFKDLEILKPVPKDDFNISEFQVLKLIGEGTFGKIYCVKWIRNNEFYALKELILLGEELNSFKKKVKIVQNLIKKIGDNGLVNIYGDKIIRRKKPNEFHYYIIMELGGIDWEREIITRKSNSLFYSEYELFEIIKQLVKTLSLMQKNNITHRDIKPQNILICKNLFKLCDFDEVKYIVGKGPILQSVRGSELYMSPILFYAYNSNVPNVFHNTYKSDVFSLGMTFFLAAALSAKPLCDIRELKDMNLISYIINNSLNIRYSQNLINVLIKMLQIDENLRVDFIELEAYVSNIWPS